MPDRDRLSDHSPHGHAADVGLLNSQSVQKADRVIPHIIQCVGHTDLLSSHDSSEGFNEVRNSGFVEFAGEPGIPIIKPDDIVASPCQVSAKVIIPEDQLPAKSYDQEEWPARRVSERVILNLNTSGIYARHFSTSEDCLQMQLSDGIL
jgi:hypothetical protein